MDSHYDGDVAGSIVARFPSREPRQYVYSEHSLGRLNPAQHSLTLLDLSRLCVHTVASHAVHKRISLCFPQ